MFGGPNPSGTGGIQIFQCVWQPFVLASHSPSSHSVGSGESLLTGQSFQEYMGPLWDVMKEKYWQWLNTTYSESPFEIVLSVT